MVIYEEIKGERIILTPEGRLDAQTAPELELKLREIKEPSDARLWLFKELVFDFSKLTYISSVGLRVVLQAQKMMNTLQGKFIIQNIAPAVREVFETTGLVDLFVKDERLIIIQQSKTRTNTVFSIVGNLDGETAPILEAHLKSLEDENLFNVWLDLTELRSIDSDGCRVLVNAKQRLHEKKGRLVLQDANALDAIKRTLATYKL
jgi:anti-sigma B factor antagonist